MNKRRLVRGIVIIIAIIILLMPLLLDQLYGVGILKKMYHNYFPAEVWFSFLGSYVPGVLFGSLTIYLTIIIRNQDLQYKKLLNSYLFVLESNAEVFRYSPENHCVGEWDLFYFSQLLHGGGDSDGGFIRDNIWQSGYILKFSVHNNGTIGIKSITCNSIEWDISPNERFLIQDKKKIKIIRRNTGESRYEFSIFWTFDDNKNSAKIIAALMNNNLRKNEDYYTSIIHLIVIITNEENEEYDMHINFKMKCPDEYNPYKLQSIEEHCHVGKI